MSTWYIYVNFRNLEVSSFILYIKYGKGHDFMKSVFFNILKKKQFWQLYHSIELYWSSSLFDETKTYLE